MNESIYISGCFCCIYLVNVFGDFQTAGSVPSNAGIGSPYVMQFIEAAVNRSFPIMLGETTPRQVGGNAMPNGCAYNDAWSSWYGPYFDMINNASLNIKSFCCMYSMFVYIFHVLVHLYVYDLVHFMECVYVLVHF